MHKFYACENPVTNAAVEESVNAVRTSFFSTIPISSSIWSLKSGPTSNCDPVTYKNLERMGSLI